MSVGLAQGNSTPSMAHLPGHSGSNGHANTPDRDPEDDNIELVDARQYSSTGAAGVQPSASVFREALNGRKRNRCFTCLADYPHPICNWLALGLALVAISLLIVASIEKYDAGKLQGWIATAEANPLSPAGDTSSPEGTLQSSIGIRQDYRGHPRKVFSEHGAVAADHGRCSDIGLKVLVDGGNAVDAAVATALCQGVLNPMASGVGGGGFMLVRTAQGETKVIDAREVAPSGATEDMFVGRPGASLEGGLAAAVPLELKGLWAAHRAYGRAPWASLVAPAAALARNGFPAHPYLINALNDSSAKLTSLPDFRAVFFKADGAGGWRPPRVNETCCVRTALADLLDAVGAQGPDALYLVHGEALAAEVQAAGGIITAQDLLSAQPLVKDAISIQAWGLNFLTPPPPAGGAAVLAGIQILSAYQVEPAGTAGSASLSSQAQVPLAFAGWSRTHRLVEAMKNAFAMRSNLGDPGVCGANAVPGVGSCIQDMQPILADMVSPVYAEELRDKISDNSSSADAASYGGEWTIAGFHDHGTSHLAAVDAQRNAVSFTTTVNTGFGCKVMSKSTGIILNNQMDDFSTPGVANGYGLPPSPSNFIRPGKKPQSSMSPLMITGLDGRVRGVMGASGGPRIISSVLTTAFRLVELGEDLLTAVAAPRVHDQVVPNATYIEHWRAGDASFMVPQQEVEALQARGHTVLPVAWSGVVQSILVDPVDDTLTAVSDPRKDGAPAGY